MLVITFVRTRLLTEFVFARGLWDQHLDILCLHSQPGLKYLSNHTKIPLASYKWKCVIHHVDSRHLVNSEAAVVRTRVCTVQYCTSLLIR